MEIRLISVEDIAKLGKLLSQFLQHFACCFARPAGRALLQIYVRGLQSDVQRKNAEAIALDQNVAPRTLQRFLESIVWDEHMLRDRCQQLIVTEHAHSEAIGCIDETGAAKSGRETTGVKRQFNGGQGRRMWFRLHEKGVKLDDVPAHHNAEAYVDAYLTAAGIVDDTKSPLFRSVSRERKLTSLRMHRVDVLRMIKRRARQSGRQHTSAATPSAQRASQNSCAMEVPWNTPSVLPHMNRCARQSSTTERRTLSASTKLNVSSSESRIASLHTSSQQPCREAA